MKLGVISDTHGFLDSQVAGIFQGVDHILHAGDVGPHELLLELQSIAPVTAVLGNTDMFIDLKLTELAQLGGRKFMIHHIVDPLELSASLKMEIREAKPDAVIFGHTHKRFFGKQNGTMFLNPGYAGRPKPNQDRSVAILDTGAAELCPEFFICRELGPATIDMHWAMNRTGCMTDREPSWFAAREKQKVVG